jgi:hypothetical protein
MSVKLHLQLKETIITNGKGYPIVAGHFEVNDEAGLLTANTAFGTLVIRKDQVEYPLALPGDFDFTTLTEETHPWILVLNHE